MNASEMGSKDWWVVVQSMPAIEAREQLDMYKASLLEQTSGKPNYIEASRLLTRVNTELKNVHSQIDNARWYKACKAVLPEEVFDAVLAYKRQLESQ